MSKCCTPEGQIKRYVDCIGCDRKLDDMKKLTAVEWLIGNLNEKNLVSTTDENFREYIKIVTQAYEMFYEQVTDAYNTSFSLRDKPYATAEKYYNVTYGAEQPPQAKAKERAANSMRLKGALDKDAEGGDNE